MPDPQEFDKEKEQLRETLINQKRLNAFNTWLADARKKSKITIQEGFEK